MVGFAWCLRGCLGDEPLGKSESWGTGIKLTDFSEDEEQGRLVNVSFGPRVFNLEI
jgi:hypothetical protein